MRVFYTQKLEILGKVELSDWKRKLEHLTKHHETLSNNWKFCALG